MSRTIQDRVVSCLQFAITIDIDVNSDTHLKSDIGMDSLDMMSFIVELEDEFYVEVSEADAKQFNTVGDVVRYISRNLRD